MSKPFNLADYYVSDRVAEGLGDRIALRYGPRTWTYSAIHERTIATGQVLLERGLKPGQRVYIILPDCPPFAWGTRS